MDDALPPDLTALEQQLTAAEQDARSIAAGMSSQPEARPTAPGAWNVAECLDHLAITNRVYLRAMEVAAVRAHRQQRTRRGPATPGWVGRCFLNAVEPPASLESTVKRRFKAPAIIRPRNAPALSDALSDFLASQAEVRTFLRSYADIDLAGVHFRNPLVPGIRFSLATGLHVIAAHERRHIWQARRVQQEQENRAR
jgi:hypothetical protein